MNWDFLIKDKDSLCVTTDSRKVTPGCLFVALRGEHFDGNEFVDQAIQDGAAYVIADSARCTMHNAQVLEFDNPVLALQDLARAWRRELRLPIIGITGTNGKTTTKELTAAVLKTKYNLYYTQGNLNNSLGVPLTLLSVTRAHEMAIVEMGASHPGDITELVEVAEPNYGLITNVGKAHLQGFGSFEGVQRTKRELYDYLVAHNGTIFINEDNEYLKQMLEKATNNLSAEGGLTAKRSYSAAVFQPRAVINYKHLPMPTDTHLVGDYNAENIAAALAVGKYFGVEEETALAAIRAYEPTNHRSQLVQTEHNTLVVDAYNANPTSMQAAIHAFNQTPDTGHQTPYTPTPLLPYTYILGAMRELGDYSHEEHQNVVNALLEMKEESVFLIGEEYRQTTAPYPIFDTVDEFIEYLELHPLQGRRILLKGSHSTQLEKLLPLL